MEDEAGPGRQHSTRRPQAMTPPPNPAGSHHQQANPRPTVGPAGKRKFRSPNGIMSAFPRPSQRAGRWRTAREQPTHQAVITPSQSARFQRALVTAVRCARSSPSTFRPRRQGAEGPVPTSRPRARLALRPHSLWTSTHRRLTRFLMSGVNGHRVQRRKWQSQS